MMRLAIMQPYFAPYIGYWQLIKSVDRFVVYDDVNYIKGGWINRNRILINDQPTYVTIPLAKASSFIHIRDTDMHPSILWREKMLKTIEMAYGKAPHFSVVFPLLKDIINFRTNSLSTFLVNQLERFASFLSIKTELIGTSRYYGNSELTGQTRILDICVTEGATNYINLEGGRILYEKEAFRRKGIELRFLKMRTFSYKQRCHEFVPNLSIIDALMEMGPKQVCHYLRFYDLT